MGRKLRYPDKIIAALPEGTITRIESSLKPGETKTNFLREAVETLLSQRATLTHRDREWSAKQTGSKKVYV
jgi:hypothetical protein